MSFENRWVVRLQSGNVCVTERRYVELRSTSYEIAQEDGLATRTMTRIDRCAISRMDLTVFCSVVVLFWRRRHKENGEILVLFKPRAAVFRDSAKFSRSSAEIRLFFLWETVNIFAYELCTYKWGGGYCKNRICKKSSVTKVPREIIKNALKSLMDFLLSKCAF